MPELSVTAARRKLRLLVDDSNPADAPTAYYALFHPAERSALFLQETAEGKPLAFVGRFQTGMDLFRPLVTLRSPTPESTVDLLAEALTPGRPYILFSSLNQLPMVGGSLEIEHQRILQIYTANPSRFQAEVNVMVRHQTAHDGTPRYEIQNESGDTLASAGLNWRSPAFAEIYVRTKHTARQRGWGKSVVSALTEHLLREGILPVYLVEHGNTASKTLIESLRYLDTGSRQVYAEVVYKGHPIRD